MKKIIIFGAGNYGKLALDYYGADRVAYFADNNEKKIGTLFFDKLIISAAELEKIKDKYRIIIAMNSYGVVKQQLINMGVEDITYFSPSYAATLNRLSDMLKIDRNTLVLVGIDEITDNIYDVVVDIGYEEPNIVIADWVDSNWIGESFKGKKVVLIDTVEKNENTVFLISSSVKAFGLQLYIENEFPNSTIINPFIPRMYYETKEIVHNPYGLNSIEITEEEWNKATENNSAMEGIHFYAEMLNKYNPLFEHVEIETINRCNGRCSFCPVSVMNEKRERTVMSEELFHKIIDELAEIKYSGRIALFSNNEPFLDSRIIELNHYARGKLPNARFHLFTNGTLLTIDKFVEIVDDLDELIIDNYNQDLELNRTSLDIVKYCEEHPELKKKVTIVLRKQQEILTSRGGDAPNRQNKPSYPSARCVLPFKQMIIRPDGRVSLCCNDPYGKVTLGDINHETLLEVWRGKAFTSIRGLLMNGRSQFMHCKECDTFIQF